jgi:fibronectin-binding autotransporter adhesin
VLTAGIDVQIALFGLVDLNTPLTLDRGASGEVAIQTNTTLRLSGFIGGPSGLRKTGVGTLTLDGVDANIFDGAVTVDGGLLRMDKALAVPSNLVMNGGTARYGAADAIAGTVRVHENGTVDLNGFNDTIAALDGVGAIELGTGVLTVSHLNLASNFSGTISGAGRTSTSTRPNAATIRSR